ncbi:MAG: ABC transporter permease [Burkholderiales bacterium]|jgi:putative ABC transport system permease protein|nr:ABC transporter permease [Burkholderiales bacterium]
MRLRTLVEPLLRDVTIATRSVLRNRRRSGLAIAATAFGVVALVLAGSFIEYILWATREGSIETSLGHLQVVRKDFFRSGLADPLAFLVTEGDVEPNALRSLPQLRTVAPRLSFNGLASHGDTTLSFIGEGVDPEREAEFAKNVVIRAGTDLSPTDPKSVLVGRGLAANLDVTVGDKLVVLANTGSGGINAVELTVRGVFSTISKAYDDAALRVPLTTAQELLRVRGVHRWVVLLNDTDGTDDAVAAVRNQLAGRDLEVVPWYDLADFYNKTAALLARQMDVVRAIVAAIVILSILNTLTMSVLERTAEIGTVMALGSRRREVLRRFLIEGTVIGLVGGVLGVVLGLVVAQIASAIGIPMPPPPGMSDGYTARLLVTPSLLLGAALLAGVTAAVASLYPAWKASRLEIVDALRHSR